MKDLSKITEIEDLRKIAERKVPRMFYDYVDSGSWTQTTYRNNETDFDRIKLRQRVLVDMDNRSLATTMIGEEVKIPIAIAPTGFTGMMWANGEMHTAKAAKDRAIFNRQHCSSLTGPGTDQRRIQWLEKTWIDNSRTDVLFGQKLGCLKGRVDAIAGRKQEDIRTLPQEFSLAKGQVMEIFIKINTLATAARIAQGRRAAQIQGRIEHVPQFVFILGHHDGQVRHIA